MISLIIFLTGSAHVWLEQIFLSGPDFCQGEMPKSELRNLYSALICGTTLSPSHAKLLFVDTGLIHLMVVSGSHLVFLEILLQFLPRGIVQTVLALYCYLTGFQAPVVRAFLRRMLARPLMRMSGMTLLQIEAATVLLALLLYPEWIVSRSFLMSWMCGLALAAPRFFPERPHFDLALKAYLFLLPFCWASPVTVAWNTLLAPFVGIVLFPACILGIFISPLVFLSDGMWSVFLKILELGPKGEPWGIFLSSVKLCWLPAVTHGALLIWEVRWRRELAFSSSPT